MARPSNSPARRAQIADALITLMADRGYEGASVSAIADEAGLNQGLVHYYFGSKRAVLLEALDRMAALHLERLEAALATAPADPWSQVDTFIDAHLGLASTSDKRMLRCWIDISGEALRHDDVRSRYRDVFVDLLDQLVGLLEAGVVQGAFDTDPPVAAAALVATIQGYLLLAGTSRDLIPRGTASRSTQAMARGLLTPGGP